LFGAISRGDRDASESIGALYDRHAPVLYAFAMQLVSDPVRAEDLLHDTFVDLALFARQPGAACPGVLRWLVQRLFARARQ
jgi:DNA-directed RNA polymerase specialized sigma24 family protein